MEQLLQQLVNGVLIGLVYSLLAIGLTLVWGVMNVLNFAHGDFLMIGMFLSYWLYTLAGVDPLFSIPVNAVALFLLGMFIYRFIISKVMNGPGLSAAPISRSSLPTFQSDSKSCSTTSPLQPRDSAPSKKCISGSEAGRRSST